MSVITGSQSYFPGIEQVRYEGPESDNPLAYRWYDPQREVAGQPMEGLFKFAVAYWHTFCGTGADPFGPGTVRFPWDQPRGGGSADALDLAKQKADAAFEFITKLGVPYYCFHDFDLVAEGADLAESARRLEAMVPVLRERQDASGVKLLWGTANLFSHPRYMNGASTNPDFRALAYAGAQLKNAIDTTIALGGENYVFWGGREGYMSLLNTDLKREREHLARFLQTARDYARSQGFTGHFFIEPKPCEPTKHQYDFDAATVIGFLREFDLLEDFKLNLEFNHATLAGHTMQHEMAVAAAASDAGGSHLLGSLDANRGDYQNGWDTDQFPVDLYELTECMLVLLEAGGLQGGGINFDAKTRRNSTDLEDLFIAHVAGIDAFARAAVTAEKVLEQSAYRELRRQRYASFDRGDGAKFEAGGLTLPQLAELGEHLGEPPQISGKQELFESLINRAL